jgi:hypothetical protein
MKKKIKISFPTDERGLIGRECPKCKKYFKVKFGTGLPTSICICPYCGEKANQNHLFTRSQIEYAKSVAKKEVLGPILKKLQNNVKRMERSTRGGFIQLKVKSRGFHFPLKHYQEKNLETFVVCDNCGLEFAVYGVFASCPDCEHINAFAVFSKSIEVSKKRLKLTEILDPSDKTLIEAVKEDALSGGISSFDAFGKALRNRYPNKLSSRSRNLFQNIIALSDCLKKSCGKSLSDLIGNREFDLLLDWFQVRHIYEHNMGVVDDDFIKHVPTKKHLKGRKHPLDIEEIRKFLHVLEITGDKILNFLDEEG